MSTSRIDVVHNLIWIYILDMQYFIFMNGAFLKHMISRSRVIYRIKIYEAWNTRPLSMKLDHLDRLDENTQEALGVANILINSKIKKCGADEALLDDLILQLKY